MRSEAAALAEIPATWSIPADLWAVWRPPTRLAVSEWADAHRYLSAESSAEPGRWRTERAEYLRGILDAFSDPLVETVVVQASAQVGKTETLNNVVGYFIDQDPAPMQVVQPDLKMAEAWSKDRLAPMLRDTPTLRGKVADAKSKSAENRILHKRFDGGHITVSGSNAPASLASRPIRVVLCDECDRFPESAGTEGDPIALVRKRATTFWNRKIGLFSTPTVRGKSRIETAYLESDRRVYRVPCPSCGVRQVLRWAQVRFENRDPETSYYLCESEPCSARWTEGDRIRGIRFGTWHATAPFKGIAGFHLSELLSPWVQLREIVDGHLKALGHRERRRAWVNLSLGETFQEEGTEVDSVALAARREVYAAEVPAGVVLLTASIDVQGDRLELKVVGHAATDPPETWVIRHQVIASSPSDPATWRAALDVLTREWAHESGLRMRISATAVDTHGRHTLEAYKFCKANRHRRVYAIRGTSGAGKAPIGRPSTSNALRVPLYTVNVDVFKERLFSRLEVAPPDAPAGDLASSLEARGVEGARGIAERLERALARRPVPGLIHFPDELDDEYFEQLTAERLEPRYSHGVARFVWRKIRTRNEALDLFVYCLVAFDILRPDLRAIARRLERRIAEAAAARDAAGRGDSAETELEALELDQVDRKLDAAARARERHEQAVEAAQRGRRKGRRGSYVRGWRR